MNMRTYLNDVTEMLKRGHGRSKLNSYHCFEDFVLQHGTEFKDIGNLPKGEKMGRLGECYANAARLAQRHRELIYVEGYACSIIPMLHGWCTTLDGKIIDPTWKNGTGYFGVPFKKKFILKLMVEHGTYGFIDMWKQGWPVLYASPRQFKQKLKLQHDHQST
jgi:hypothetical protein